ncbi:pep-cterm sorting domain-containing protein [Anaeramoeba ignava]|uniref:Pep-cterm sorting domain-containing protein n=1 Tax=Anaeramoeba ignava TaxID=1746090 RepID=A0A9Q0L616_ANAIG|nr:pep-cterm sorting domain-containing protein [Anaeramoeba ignava]
MLPVDIQVALKKLYKDTKTQDLILKIGKKETELKAHKFILSTKSEFFKKKLTKETKEYKNESIEPEIMQSIIKYFYMGYINIHSGNCVPLLTAAIEFGIEELEQIVLDFFQDFISVENVLDHFNLFVEKKIQRAISHSLALIAQNSKEILKNDKIFQLLPESLKWIIQSDILEIYSELDIFWLVLNYARKKCGEEKYVYQKNAIRRQNRKIKKEFQNFSQFIRLSQLQDYEYDEIKHFHVFLPKHLIDMNQFWDYQYDKSNKFATQIEEIKKKYEDVDYFREKRSYSQNRNILRLLPQTKKTLASVLDESQIQQWIPEFSSDIQPIYSAKRDGFDCRSYLEKCQNVPNLLFLIKTTRGDIFGAFLNSSFEIKDPLAVIRFKDPSCFVFIARICDKEEYIKCDPQNKDSVSFAYYPDRGPLFGEGWDIGILEYMVILSLKLGISFQKPQIQMSDEAEKILSGVFKKLVIEEMQVYSLSQNQNENQNENENENQNQNQNENQNPKSDSISDLDSN